MVVEGRAEAVQEGDGTESRAGGCGGGGITREACRSARRPFDLSRLATVVSRRPDAPRWTLVDEHNNILAFIAPQSGVNLAPLVGQQVSVRGSKGYMPEYKRPYLVASEARTRIASVPTPQAAAGDRTQ